MAREQLVVSLGRALAYPSRSPSPESGALGGEVAALGPDVVSNPLLGGRCPSLGGQIQLVLFKPLISDPNHTVNLFGAI